MPTAANAPRPKRGVIHQCYFGAPTDSIKSMISAIAAMLQQSGTPSKIFANDAGGFPGIMGLDFIPGHDDCVIIAHRANDETPEEFAAITRLTAPIILVQHHSPSPGLGSSLQRWMPFVATALGCDSATTRRLRLAGFPNASTLTLRATAAGRHAGGHPHAPYTIVVPGDVRAVGFASTIVDAFAEFQRHWSAPARLILLGRTLEARMTKDVQDRIAAHGLGEAVMITGSTDAITRSQCVAEADICLFLEDVPALPNIVLEAVEVGVPVVARQAPALASHLPDAGTIARPQHDDITTILLEMARDPVRAMALAFAQRLHAKPDGVQSSDSVLWNAFGQCGVALPPSRAENAAFFDQAAIVIAGHFDGSYSLASVNRLLASAIEQRNPGRVSILPVLHQPLDTLEGIPPHQAPLMNALFDRRRTAGAPRIVISQHYPPWVPNVFDSFPVALFAWEESRVPASIIQTLNTGFACVLAVSTFVAKALIDSGLRIPVRVTGQGIELEPYLDLGAARAGAASGQGDAADSNVVEPFVFLHVSSCFPRKGVDLLLAAWAQAFTEGEAVTLVLKGSVNQHNDVEEQLGRLRIGNPGLAPVTYIDCDLDQSAMLDLYRAAHCMVLPTRGEGFNMAAAEAMAASLPLIVTGHGGHMDFVDSSTARLLDFRFGFSTSHLATAGSLWAEPQLDDLVAALREALADHRTGGAHARLRAERGRQVAASRFGAAAWADRTMHAVAAMFEAPMPALRRVAWISSWGVRCGIAEYSRALLENRPTGRGAPEILMLCDVRTNAVPAVPPIDGVHVSSCWSTGSGGIALQVKHDFTRFEPQVVVIQHQPGLIGWQELIDLIDLSQATQTCTLVTLHSTESLNHIGLGLRSAAVLSLAAAQRVVVHALRDIETLRSYGLVDNVVLLPHGAVPLGSAPAALEAPRKTGRAPVIGSYGFFLPHKGIATLIAAFASIRARWPGATLRLVNAQFPAASSVEEIRHCRTLAKQLGVDDAIAWETRYLDDDASLDLLSGCDLIVMPYQETPESASGAVRLALSSGVPVAVSAIGFFDDLRDAAHRVDANDPAQLSDGIARLLEDNGLRRSTMPRAAQWLREHAWDLTASRLFGMAQGVFQQGVPVSRSSSTIFTADNQLFQSQLGKRIGRSMVIRADTAGFGLYGPYIPLAIGAYRVELLFDDASERSGTALMDIAAQAGHQFHAARHVRFEPPADDGHRIQLDFTLTEPSQDTEIRLFCNLDFRATLLSVSIHRTDSDQAASAR